MPRKPKPKDRRVTALAFGYNRVSTNKQDVSIEVQAEQIEGYYKWKLSHSGVGWAQCYTDPAVSGPIPFRDREAGFALATRVQPGDHIIIAKFDRAFRNAIDGLQCVEAWTSRGIHVHFLDIGVDMSTPVGKLITGIMAIFAEFEHARIRERILDAKRHLKAKGLPASAVAPLGRRIVVGKDGSRHFEWDEYELRLMLRIYQMRQNGEPFRRIAEKLTEAGVEHRNQTGHKGDTRHWKEMGTWRYHNSYLKLLEKGKLPEYALPGQSA